MQAPSARPPAGALDVPARTFALWQAVGGALWTVGLVLAGYALGSSVPDVDRYLLPMVAAIVALSLVPLGRELRKDRKNRRRATAPAPAPDAGDRP